MMMTGHLKLCQVKCILLLLFGTITVFAEQPKVVPKSVITELGTEVRFICTASTSEQPVNWSTVSYGTNSSKEIYAGDPVLLGEFGMSGRFSVDTSEPFRHDLIIRNVQRTDAGVYICTDDMGEKADAELIVTDSYRCDSAPTNSDENMTEKKSELKLKELQFSCVLGYTGNQRVHLQWTLPDGIKSKEKEMLLLRTDLSQISSELTLEATNRLNGATVKCEAVLHSKQDESVTSVQWMSQPIQVKHQSSPTASGLLTLVGIVSGLAGLVVGVVLGILVSKCRLKCREKKQHANKIKRRQVYNKSPKRQRKQPLINQTEANAT